MIVFYQHVAGAGLDPRQVGQQKVTQVLQSLMVRGGGALPVQVLHEAPRAPLRCSPCPRCQPLLAGGPLLLLQRGEVILDSFVIGDFRAPERAHRRCAAPATLPRLRTVRQKLLQVALRMVVAAADLTAPGPAEQSIEYPSAGIGDDAVRGIRPEPHPDQQFAAAAGHCQLDDSFGTDLAGGTDAAATHVGAHEADEPGCAAELTRPPRQSVQPRVAGGERDQQPVALAARRVQLEHQLLVDRLAHVPDEAAGEFQLRQYGVDFAPVQTGTHRGTAACAGSAAGARSECPDSRSGETVIGLDSRGLKRAHPAPTASRKERSSASLKKIRCTRCGVRRAARNSSITP